MKGTKTQAEKRQEREAKIAEAARLRQEEAERRRAAFASASASASSASPQTVLIVQQDRRGSARLVLNHSTHIDGLIETLRLLCHRLDGRYTITPGVIHNRQSARGGGLDIVRQRSDDLHKARYIAQNGSSIQEVFIALPGDEDEDSGERELLLSKLDEHIQACLSRIARSYETGSDDDHQLPLERGVASSLCRLENLNRKMAEERANEWKEEHKVEHQRVQEREKEGRQSKAIAERERKLRAKVGADDAEAYAERDEAIVSGQSRTKNSMK